MLRRALSSSLDLVFCFVVLIVATGGFDHHGSLGSRGFRIDATAPDLAMLLFLLLLAGWRALDGQWSELWCCRVLLDAYDRLTDPASRRWPLAVAGALSAVLLIVPQVRHQTFHTGYDLAIFAQAYWNTLQGEFLYSSILGMVLWGDHFNPVALAILPFYWLWPSPEVLLLLQSLALAAGAWPLYLLARRELSDRGVAIVLALAYLVYLPMRQTNLFEFHPVALATPLILGAVYQLRRGAYGWFLVLCLLIGATKETGPIAVVLLGLACFFLSPRRILGVAVSVVGAIWFFVNLAVVMPAFNPAGVDTQLDRYHYLGDTPFEILKTLVTRPLYVVSHNFTSTELFYPIRILAPVAFLPLITPVGLLTVPYLLINVLEGSGVQVWLVHYQAELTAFVFVAAVFGAKKALARRTPGWVAASLMAGSMLFFGTSDLYKLRQGWPTAETRRIHAVLEGLPTDVSLSAQAALAPHLANRSSLLLFPEVEGVERVVVDAGLDPWPVPPERFRRTVRRLKRTGFQIDTEVGSTTVFHRDPQQPTEWRPRRDREP